MRMEYVLTPDGHILRKQVTLSRYAANGYWAPDAIQIWDAQGNERHGSTNGFWLETLH